MESRRDFLKKAAMLSGVLVEWQNFPPIDADVAGVIAHVF